MKKLILISLILGFIFTAKGQAVQLVNLDQLNARINNGKDTTFILNFWATWCVPCIKELPHFEQLQKEYKNLPLKVLLISLDFKSKLNSDVIPFVKKQKIKSDVFLLNEKNQQVYIDQIDKNWSGAIPATLFINNSKGIRKFMEEEFTYAKLLKQYKSL